MAHRLFAQTFGTPELPNSLTTAPAGRAKMFSRLDRARSKASPEYFETFSWAAGHGYCTFLSQAAARQDSPLVHLLNGRRNGCEVPPPLWRAAKRHQAAAVVLLLELRADAESWEPTLIQYILYIYIYRIKLKRCLSF
eukprot:Skav219814  [mRNA]  locus=scaffold147:311176:311589:- [translate_table: standard]